MFERVLPALGLLVLAPLVGNIAVNALPMIIGLIPLHGGGALLIREVARRWRLGWPGIILLGLAYAVIEEGLVTYAWHGFPQPPSFPAPAQVDLIGNAVFALAALGLLASVAVRLRQPDPRP